MLATPRSFIREVIKLTLASLALVAVALVVIQYAAPTALQLQVLSKSAGMG